ncbi:CpsD/CapB family tyrosine-protein kinase [Aestuariicoccus sp. MJ-SS9]|uniref:CpsD/CapB family tyrosine-protein kinase n=1 Tax=Aestuariicoccus sp. MJ-SS9 TaxID=3079855 RepID=UPI00290E3C1C|nr:CpsD/CapB family tyrosine-protein kinase [Aestuariicoccus sp. MJ-SS9]MDU8910814.1 CpsD/CapB family tyrosine-protein kinase [Aestuariicoccus sp. MJ-SS9]
MNMANRPKFTRKRKTAPEPASEELEPIAPLESRSQRDARKAAEAAEAQAAERRRRASEAAARKRAEARKAEEARKAAAEQDRRAEEARVVEASRKAEAARKRAAQKKAEEAQRAEEVRAEQEAAAKRKAEEARPAKALPAAPERPAERPVPQPPAVRPETKRTGDIWQSLDEFPIDERHLDRNRIITASRHDPAHAAFDVLRTRLLQALSQNGWKRVAITSPTKDCGKTFTAANLAISLSRQENCRTLLLDCDMRKPSLHKVMGARDPGSMGDMLRGAIAPERHLQRPGPNTIHVGHNLAFGFNGISEPYAAELLQDPRCAGTLRKVDSLFDPDVILFDLPPALYSDDVIAFRPQVDGVLLVVGGGLTTEKEVREVERRLGDTPLLGTVLNRAEGTQLRKYLY